MERVCLRRSPLPQLGGWSTVVHNCVSIHTCAHMHFSLSLGPISHLQDPGRGKSLGTCAPLRTWYLADIAVCVWGGGWDTLGTSAPSNLPWPFFHQPLTCLRPASLFHRGLGSPGRPSLPLAKHAAPPPPGCDDGCRRGASPTAWGKDSFSPTPAGHQPSDPSLQGTPDFVFAVIAWQG